MRQVKHPALDLTLVFVPIALLAMLLSEYEDARLRWTLRATNSPGGWGTEPLFDSSRVIVKPRGNSYIRRAAMSRR